MSRASRLNPSGVRSYDHTALADLPEYRALGDAVRALTRAVNAAGIPMAVDDYLDAVTDLTAGTWVTDGCPKCVYATAVPYRVVHDDRGTVGHYRCTCGHSWWCTYALASIAAIRA